MKKITMLVCLLGLSAAAYAQMGSPVWDAKIISVGMDSSRQTEDKKAQEKEAQKIAAAKATAQKAQIEAAAKAAALSDKAQKAASEADDYLKVLIKHNGNFKAELHIVLSQHQHLVKVLQKAGNLSFVYQEVEIALENLAASVQAIKYAKLADKVKNAINHEYYFAMYENKLASLKEIAENVNDECLILGNGVKSAGLQDNGFYAAL